MIRFDNVSMGYGTDDRVLRDLSFEIESGSFQFLTGASGAGKTSLLRLLFLQERPMRGAITLFGKDLQTLAKRELPAIRRRIGIVFQDFRLLNHLSVYENVSLPLKVRGRAESSYRADVIELLKWVGLSECIAEFPQRLSGGEQQRAAIARALINQPELLLADEPTGNLDPELSARLLRLFIELNRGGTSVIIATHDLALMDQYDARRMVLDGGRLTIYD